MSQPAPFIITPPGDLLRTHAHIKGMADRLSSAYADHPLVEENHLQAIGQALWDALPDGDTLAAAKQATGQQTLPIIIESDNAAILTLPWETLYHPTYGFLGREAGFSLSRRNPAISVVLPNIRCEPLRVLLFTSLPDDLSELERLDVEAEQAAVQEALMDQEKAGEIVLEMPDDGRLETFRDSLQQFQPHLVYLSGHGNFTYEHHNREAWGSFLFENAIGRKQDVTETELVTCFQTTEVQLLVMSACFSAKQHPNYPHSGLSAALYQAGIPHVIGMRESVFDKAGIQFAKALLQTLGEHKSVDVALQKARNAITQPFKEAGGYKEGSNPIRTEASYGQWCLPQLLSHDLHHGLIDWNFTPQPQQRMELKTLLGQISVPEHFRGRRRELRQWQNRLRHQQNSLLITGIGGMGKTALAYKLLQGLHKDDYQTFSFSLRPEHDWQSVLLDLELALAEDEGAYKKYELIQRKGLDAAAQASYFLKFLLARFGGKLVLFFDNLESVQDGHHPHTITDTALTHWLQAARQLTAQGLKLILTSRWRLPDWADAEHYPLGKPVYGDYVAMVRLKGLPLSGQRLQTAYATLGGNFRALEFFAEATKTMSVQEEQAFLDALDKAADDSQTDMALAKVLEQRNADEHALLHRLLAYQTTVPLTGLEVLWDVETAADADSILQRLLAVSLVEQFNNPHTGETEYQLAPLVRSWLLAHGIPMPPLPILQTAANFLLWQLEEYQNTTWEHKLTTHAALLAANLTEQGQRLVLDWIIGPLNRAGMYQTLLDDWLPPLAEADNQQIRGVALGQIGKQYLHIGGYNTALDYLQQSLAIQQEIGDKQGMGATLNNISQIYDARGDYNTALNYLKQSLAIQQEIGDKSGEGTTLNNMATTAHARGDYDTALNYLKQSLAIRQEIGDKSGEGTTLNNISQIYDARGDYDTALNYLKQSLAIRQEIGDKSGEGTTLNNISQIYDARGDYDTALNYLKQSLAIRQEIGDKSGEGTTLNNISQIYDARGDYDTALNYLKQSLAIQQEIGDKSGEGTTLNNMATTAHARGDYDTALNYLKQSLAIQQEIGDKSGEGTTLNNMATTAHARGDYDTALNYLKQSLAIRQEIGDKSGKGTTLNNISQIFKARGDYDTALNYLKQSLAIQQEIGDKSGEGTTLNNMATTAHARGDYDTALNYLKQSLAIQQEIGDKSGEGTTLNNMATTAHARGDYDTALNYLKQSLAIQQEIGDKSGEGTTLNNISQIFKARGDYDTALNYLKQSLAIRQEIGDKSGKGTTLNNISQIFKARGDYDTALNYLKQSLAIQQEIGDVAGLCATLFNMGHIHLQNEEVNEAVQAWVTVYGIAKKINLANVLQALEKLAGDFGLPGGLQGWEMLAQQMSEE